MSLSVIIPSRNFANLRACVTGLHNADQVSRLIIIDDALAESGYHAQSSDYELGACLDGSTILPCVKPFVFARAINQGIAAAGIDDVVLLNDDALLETPGGFTAMQQWCQEHPEYGLLSARVKGLSNPVHAWPAWPHVWPREVAEVPVCEVSRAIPFVCVYIPRRVLDCVGPLDERFTGEIAGEKVYGGEDDDYCYRIRKAGYKLGVFNGCVVDHGTLPSTFRGLNGSLPINATRQRFREIHGFEMGTR